MKDDNDFPFEEDDFDWDEEKENDIGFISKRESDFETLEIMFVDFQYDVDNENDDVSFDDVQDGLLREDSIQNIVSPVVSSKRVQLGSDYVSDDDVKEKFIEKAIELSERNFHGNDIELYEKFNFKPAEHTENIRRKFLAKINNASSVIAVNGRIGPAQYMIVSENNYNNYELSILENIKPVFYDTDDIILFRKNRFDQPGLVYITNNEKYYLVDIGFYPEKQFIKIKIDNED